MVDNTPHLPDRFDSWDYCRGDFDVTNSMDDKINYSNQISQLYETNEAETKAFKTK